MKRCAFRSLHAVVRPQHLPTVVHFDRFERLAARVAAREGKMAFGMPVLGERDMLEAPRQRVDGRNHPIALGDRKRAARTEVVLNVDDQQQVANRIGIVHGSKRMTERSEGDKPRRRQKPSRSSRLRSSLRARRMASALSRARRSEGFS